MNPERRKFAELRITRLRARIAEAERLKSTSAAWTREDAKQLRSDKTSLQRWEKELSK